MYRKYSSPRSDRTYAQHARILNRSSSGPMTTRLSGTSLPAGAVKHLGADYCAKAEEIRQYLDSKQNRVRANHLQQPNIIDNLGNQPLTYDEFE